MKASPVQKNKNRITKAHVGAAGWRYWALLKVFRSLWSNLNGGSVNAPVQNTNTSFEETLRMLAEKKIKMYFLYDTCTM